jgi:DUF1365 family protein
MAILTEEGTGNNLVGINPATGLSEPLTDEVFAPAVASAPVFPLMLLMRLRIHAILFWGTILLMQTIP